MTQFPLFEKFTLYDESVVIIATNTSSPVYLMDIYSLYS